MIGSVGCLTVWGQGTNTLPNSDYAHLIDRLEIQSGAFIPGVHTSVKGYNRKHLAVFLDTLALNKQALSTRDQFNLQYLLQDNWEFATQADTLPKRGLLSTLYTNSIDCYSVNTPAFKMRFNPVFHFSGGQSTEEDLRYFINTRGAEVRGLIDGKVGFYSFIGENQARFPEYVRELTREGRYVPGEIFFKGFKDQGVDFFTARGYISLNATRHINVQFGHDKFFIGNGYRSVILSDYGAPYTYLKLNTRVWKIDYTNLFTEMRAHGFVRLPGEGDRNIPRKYMVFHRLGINLTERLNVGFFESVMYGQPDSLGSSGFEFGYLNPIIFYRAIESGAGSQSNAILGADAKWNIGKSLSLYGQFTLDEFLLENIRARNGWWANKYALQAGLKYINVFGIRHLDLQAEYNTIRPFTFQHRDQYTNYAHYRQPLAHPLGANFREYLAILRYQPIKRVNLTAKFIRMEQGLDSANINFGGQVMDSYNTRYARPNDIGHFTTQGIAAETLFTELTLTWMLRNNIFVDLKYLNRNRTAEWPGYEQHTHAFFVSFRMNIPQRLHDF
ncbi:capsule assembly Wzi family protein [Cytophagales bacterium LB-30]|uniref:Capsule assembly Wzi family protein n=1 Tax=Shiella aurantiaca TaxID=3058365 RepID=A0ABT8F333_9BACT|nr:capsule assembly Wzi family protein [Shiella aurantiaca]MDN4164649.1 capsule assembly Wzi family protein [Shiella aurantiaca]